MIEETDHKCDGTIAKWATFCELFTVYLGLIYGSSGVPLVYIIHSSLGADYSVQDKRAQLIACAPLNGCVFDHGNRTIYDHLKGLVLDGPGWAWIWQFDQKCDGHVVWLCSLHQYKGPVNFNHLVDTAKAKIEQNLQHHGTLQHHDNHVTNSRTN